MQTLQDQPEMNTPAQELVGQTLTVQGWRLVSIPTRYGTEPREAIELTATNPRGMTVRSLIFWKQPVSFFTSGNVHEGTRLVFTGPHNRGRYTEYLAATLP